MKNLNESLLVTLKAPFLTRKGISILKKELKNWKTINFISDVKLNRWFSKIEIFLPDIPNPYTLEVTKVFNEELTITVKPPFGLINAVENNKIRWYDMCGLYEILSKLIENIESDLNKGFLSEVMVSKYGDYDKANDEKMSLYSADYENWFNKLERNIKRAKISLNKLRNIDEKEDVIIQQQTNINESENFLNNIIMEQKTQLTVINESELQDKYKEFFNKKLEDFDVKSPAELDDEKKKEFFNSIKKEWSTEKKKYVGAQQKEQNSPKTLNESELQDKYKEFFNKKLEDFDVKSPAELDEEKKKEFFNSIKKEWATEKKKYPEENLNESINNLLSVNNLEMLNEDFSDLNEGSKFWKGLGNTLKGAGLFGGAVTGGIAGAGVAVGTGAAATVTTIGLSGIGAAPVLTAAGAGIIVGGAAVGVGAAAAVLGIGAVAYQLLRTPFLKKSNIKNLIKYLENLHEVGLFETIETDKLFSVIRCYLPGTSDESNMGYTITARKNKLLKSDIVFTITSDFDRDTMVKKIGKKGTFNDTMLALLDKIAINISSSKFEKTVVNLLKKTGISDPEELKIATETYIASIKTSLNKGRLLTNKLRLEELGEDEIAANLNESAKIDVESEIDKYVSEKNSKKYEIDESLTDINREIKKLIKSASR